jgi:hypothetical protein
VRLSYSRRQVFGLEKSDLSSSKLAPGGQGRGAYIWRVPHAPRIVKGCRGIQTHSPAAEGAD